jgi:hypothetical protein
MTMKPLFILPVLLFLTQLPAWAQESSSSGAPSRGARIERERKEKAGQLKPDEPGKAEREFEKYEYLADTIFAAPRAGIRPKFSSSAPGWGGLIVGSGFSLGPEYYRPDLAKGEVVFRTSAIGTVKQNYLFDTQLTLPRAVDNRMVFDFLGRYKAERSINYFGPGPDSQKGSRTDYSKESSELNFRVGWKPMVRHLQDTVGELIQPVAGCRIRATNGVTRVLACGRPANHAATRTKLIAAAVITCCRCVLASPI